MNGKALMPTKRYDWVRRALRDGRAVPVKTVPFTIRLTYQPKTKEVQIVRITPDTGRTNPELAAVREDGMFVLGKNILPETKKSRSWFLSGQNKDDDSPLRGDETHKHLKNA